MNQQIMNKKYIYISKMRDSNYLFSYLYVLNT